MRRTLAQSPLMSSHELDSNLAVSIVMFPVPVLGLDEAGCRGRHLTARSVDGVAWHCGSLLRGFDVFGGAGVFGFEDERFSGKMKC